MVRWGLVALVVDLVAAGYLGPPFRDILGHDPFQVRGEVAGTRCVVRQCQRAGLC